MTQENENMQNGHDDTQKARAILAGLLSEPPTHPYAIEEAGYYSPGLKRVAQARKNGKTAAVNYWHNFVAVSPGYKCLDDTLAEACPEKEEEGSEEEEETPSPYPPLPEKSLQPTGLLSQVAPWLSKYIEYSQCSSPEGYTMYHLACGLWTLSTTAARRIRVPLSQPVITPLSLILVGRTSLFAKTTTANAGKALLKKAGLGFLLGADETTPQKLLYNMAGHVPQNYAEMPPERQAMIKQRLAMAGQLGWYYDEVNQLLNAMTRQGPMAEFAGLIRKLDNCPDEYRYETKSGGDDYIQNPYVAFLGSVPPANLAKHAGKGCEFWNDGFWARILWACPPPNDFVTSTMDEGIVEPPDDLVKALVEWNTRLGVPRCDITEVLDDKGKGTGKFTVESDPLPMTDVTLEKGVHQAFERYRVALRELISKNNMQDLDGSYARLPTVAMRIAALIASMEHHGRISLDVWAVAQELSEMFRKNLHELYRQVSTSPEDDDVLEDELITYLKTLEDQRVTIRDIQQKGPIKIIRLKAKGIRELLLTLERSGIVCSGREGRKELFWLSKKDAV